MPPKPKQDIKTRLRQKLANKKGEKKICLTMIVKNESKNIPRLLNSTKSVVNMISIVDTGSSDNTIEVINKWGLDNNMPTKVHQEPFKNFAHNRTHSIRMAKQAFPDADYFLLSDADFVWQINGTFNKVLLIDHKYLIRQYNRNLDYWNIRLLSAKVDWECVGVTHEYWRECNTQTEYRGEIRSSKINGLVINDIEDGGCKEDKFTRDERLLKQGLEEEQDEGLKTRYKFYLAQTLKDIHRFYEAIEWYKKRIEDGGWFEEVYYAKFQMGFCYEQLAWKYDQCIHILSKPEKTEDENKFLNKWNKDDLTSSNLVELRTIMFDGAETNYFIAYKYRSCRAEALYYLTRMCRIKGEHKKAYDYAIEGAKIKYPASDTLFIEKNCYEFLFDYEICIVAYYVEGAKQRGAEACAKLLEYENLPEQYMKLVEHNSRFYI